MQVTDRVAALARPAEVLVSLTVKDLVTGSDICFAERGSHELAGLPDGLPLFAVARSAVGPRLRHRPALQVLPHLGDAAVQVVQGA